MRRGEKPNKAKKKKKDKKKDKKNVMCAVNY